MKTRTLTASQAAKVRFKEGWGVYYPRRRRLTMLIRDEDGSHFCTRCDYCGGWWKTYQQEHHNLPECPMKSK